MTLRRAAVGIVAGLVLLMAGPMLTLAFGPVSLRGDWRTATHRPAGLAPDPASHDEAIVQIYASRAFGWRGAFAVHTWLAAKPAGSDRYVRYEVIGWNLRSGSTAVSVSDRRAPDAEWFGATPYLIRDLRGDAAKVVIDKLPQAVASYPYAGTYRAWPGPNSNTFIAHLGRAIPELRVRLPSLAIGKDYLPDGQFLARTPSGTGYQVSFHGILGAAAGSEEGLELNVFGLVTGVDWLRPALVLPGIGRIPPG